MPVAHSDEYGKRRTTPFQCQFQPTRLLECQFVDRRPPSNEFIMMGNLINPLLWNRTPARHIRKKRANIFSFFRPPNAIMRIASNLSAIKKTSSILIIHKNPPLRCRDANFASLPFSLLLLWHHHLCEGVCRWADRFGVGCDVYKCRNTGRKCAIQRPPNLARLRYQFPIPAQDIHYFMEWDKGKVYAQCRPVFSVCEPELMLCHPPYTVVTDNSYKWNVVPHSRLKLHKVHPYGAVSADERNLPVGIRDLCPYRKRNPHPHTSERPALYIMTRPSHAICPIRPRLGVAAVNYEHSIRA